MHFQPGTSVDLATIRDQRWIFDAIYSPINTELILQAINAGQPTINGFELFLGQAIDAFEIFTGHRLTFTVLADLESRMRVVEREREF